MIVCWDASAIVKLVVHEPGAELAAALWAEPVSGFASTLVVPEVTSALARRRADGTLVPRAHAAATAAVRLVHDDLHLVELTAERAERAADVVAKLGLRGADAVHLATALEVADAGGHVAVLTWDRRLHRAATAAGLDVAPAELR